MLLKKTPSLFISCMSIIMMVMIFTGCEDVRMKATPERMKQWNDWKFGMFIHWGAWSQAEIGFIWQITKNDPPEEREKRFDLYKTFNPVKYDPKEWARVAKEAGMKYVVFTSKHHDGFCNWDTKTTELRVTHHDCPYSKSPNPDILKELINAYRAEGLAIGIYFSHIDWHHPDARRFSMSHWEYKEDNINTDPEAWARNHEFEKAQVTELLTKYGKIDIFWFDIRWPSSAGNGAPYQNPRVKKDMTELVKMMRAANPNLIINNRGVDIYGDFDTPEQRIPTMGIPGYWESNITISEGRGYWYKGKEATYKSRETLVRLLVDIASKGGNFLCNVGPTPDGTITPQETQALKEVGEWMKINGESVYGTTRTVFRFIEWGRCTVKGNTLYLHVFNWPENGQLVVPGLKNEIEQAYLLADKNKSPLAVSKEGNNIVIQVRDTAPDPIDTVIVLKVKGDYDVDNMINQKSNGEILLQGGEAELKGEKIKYVYGAGVRHGDYIENWNSADDNISWEFSVGQPGTFNVEITYSCHKSQAGSTFSLSSGEQVLNCKIKETTKNKKISGKEKEFTTETIGKIKFDNKGVYKVVIKPDNIKNKYLMLFRSIRMVKE